MKWYRFVDRRTAGPADEFGDPVPNSGSTEITLLVFEEIKRTPKGVWISLYFSNKRFVLLSAHRRFACPSIEEARQSFIARKRRQLYIYETRAQRARETLRHAEHGLTGSCTVNPMFSWLTTPKPAVPELPTESEQRNKIARSALDTPRRAS